MRLCPAFLSMVLVGALATGCGSSSTDSSTVTVFAAASLSEAFKAIASDFEAANPGVSVQLQFAGSQSLRTQIEQGASPHVFASANHQHMQALVSAELAEASSTFANNHLVVVAPRANPAGLETFADLPRAESLVLAGATVPAGAYADQVIERSAAVHGATFADRVRGNIVSRELHVRQTLQKVVLGEADAAMVYATDATAVGDKVVVIPIPRELNETASYPIAEVEKSALGSEFIDFVHTAHGRALLEKHGFVPSNKLATR